jgi:hypothetical protein
MAWPESILSLLASKSSPASQAVRWGLHGLRATLRAALQEGADELRGLLADLDPLLDGNSAGDPVLPSDDVEDALSLEKTHPTARRLVQLARAMAEDPRLGPYLQAAPIRAISDDDVWNQVQRLLLRVPADVAGEWQKRSLDHAQQIGAWPDQSRTAVVPLLRDENIYPGLSGAIQAMGLRSATSAALDPRVKPPADSSLRFLAGVVSTYVWFAEHDPHLAHCLKGVFSFGITPLRDGQGERYRDELLRLWERVQNSLAEPPSTAARPWFKDRLREQLDLDEALHSLLYQPLPAADSWWGMLQTQAREVLLKARDRAAQAGCPAHLQVLGGPFAEINRLAPDSLQVDFGVPGEVAACLRVWARVDGEESKGRVLYRSPREEP